MQFIAIVLSEESLLLDVNYKYSNHHVKIGILQLISKRNVLLDPEG